MRLLVMFKEAQVVNWNAYDIRVSFMPVYSRGSDNATSHSEHYTLHFFNNMAFREKVEAAFVA